MLSCLCGCPETSEYETYSWLPLNVPQLGKNTLGWDLIQLLDRCVLGLLSSVNFLSMLVGFTQSTSYLHRVHYKGSHTRNKWGKGDCHSRTVVVGCSVLSEVSAVNLPCSCPCFGCNSAKKPKYFIIV